jgi:flagellar biosynthesis protein FlhF
MKVKKFRAATTREALEKIKLELGEDAFVLETKQVKTGGLMGFGGAMQIEVSAAVPASRLRKEKKSQAADSQSAAVASILGLSDETPAMPGFTSEKRETTRTAKSGGSVMPALAARAFAVESGDAKALVVKSGFAPRGDEVDKKRTENSNRGVEISDAAPRIVHAKKDSQAPAPKKEIIVSEGALQEADVISTKAVEGKPSQSVSYELERLRAEMREVKFALGTFAARQTSLAGHASVPMESTIELYDSPFYEAYLELTASGVSHEIARDAICRMIPAGGDQFASPAELAYCGLLKALPALVRFAGEDPLGSPAQNTMVFVGATGVGKTTTLAKLAARAALRERRRVELITLDTYRIAAVEQLKTYAEIIGAGFTVVRSALELDATLTRMPEDAVVLIDTTGRSPHDLADQLGFIDYLRNREDILKCLVLQATTHPQDAVIGAKKFALYGANCLALTKFDETTRPGASLEIAAETALPLVYFCDGQRVPEDLQAATPGALAARITGAPANTKNQRDRFNEFPPATAEWKSKK